MNNLSFGPCKKKIYIYLDKLGAMQGLGVVHLYQWRFSSSSSSSSCSTYSQCKSNTCTNYKCMCHITFYHITLCIHAIMFNIYSIFLCESDREIMSQSCYLTNRSDRFFLILTHRLKPMPIFYSVTISFFFLFFLSNLLSRLLSFIFLSINNNNYQNLESLKLISIKLKIEDISSHPLFLFIYFLLGRIFLF